MCGICGVIGSDGIAATESMMRRMAHRGPDDTGIRREGDACLGHTRLSIMDLSNAGHQPMSNEDGTVWITFNGEIYNFKKLKKELMGRGHLFRSDADTETILHLYEEKGDACLEDLRGMFAFAIWDIRRQRLFAARDRFGIKPFFYYLRDGALAFSSELDALLGSGIPPREVDKEALAGYFTYGSVQAPRTLIKDVLQLMPGHSLTFDKGGIALREYWRLDPSQPTEDKLSFVGGASMLGERFEEAVRMRLMSDVPIGLFLSGGIDSSVIAAMMQKCSETPVKTFSVVFEDPAFDESRFSRRVAAALGTDHTEIMLKSSDILADIDDVFKAMDQPSIDGFNTFVISRAAKRAGLKVALSGLGGDELFAGYKHFRSAPKAAILLKLLRKIPRPLRDGCFRALSPLARTRGGLKKIFSAFKCETLQNLCDMQRRVFLPYEISRLVKDGKARSSYERGRSVATPDKINAISYAELTGYLRNTLLQDTDRMSMAGSLEVRVPFLDHLFVEDVFRVPGRMKTAGQFSKQLLMEAAGRSLPPGIHERPKMGFVFPFERWLRTDLRAYCEDLFSEERLERIEVLDPEEVKKIWRGFLEGTGPYNYSSVLCLISFVNWYERNISL